MPYKAQKYALSDENFFWKRAFVLHTEAVKFAEGKHTIYHSAVPVHKVGQGRSGIVCNGIQIFYVVHVFRNHVYKTLVKYAVKLRTEVGMETAYVFHKQFFMVVE